MASSFFIFIITTTIIIITWSSDVSSSSECDADSPETVQYLNDSFACISGKLAVVCLHGLICLLSVCMYVCIIIYTQPLFTRNLNSFGLKKVAFVLRSFCGSNVRGQNFLNLKNLGALRTSCFLYKILTKCHGKPVSDNQKHCWKWFFFTPY